MIRSLLPILLPALILAACSEPRFFEQDNPQRLSDWNLFERDRTLLLPREETLVFAPVNPLFSDYAGKLRTMWLPPGAQARLQDGELDFPVGSVLSKTFYYPSADDGTLLAGDAGVKFLDAQQHRMLETRLLVRREDGWHAMAYVWNVDQTEAFLRVAGASIPVSLRRISGTEDFVYFVPNENQCSGCHVTVHPDGPLHPLGAVPDQLAAAIGGIKGHPSSGTTMGHPSTSTTTMGAVTKGATYLHAMQERGWLAQLPPQPAADSWQDSEADLDTRAHAYLKIHCGHCHNPDGAADTSALVLDGNHRSLVELGVCKTPVAAGGGAGELLYGIHPGAPERSILLYRMESSELDEMMPELGRSLVHEEGVALIRDWIAGMDGDCPEPVRTFGAR